MPSVSGDLPAFLEDINLFGLAGVAENADAREVEPSSVETHDRGGVLPVVDTEPALADGTAGVELAGGAERATTAKPKALEPWAYSEAGCEGPRHCRERAGATATPCRKATRARMNSNAVGRQERVRKDVKVYLKCHHKSMSASAMCRHERTRTRVPWQPGILKGSFQESKYSIREGLLRPRTSQGHHRL